MLYPKEDEDSHKLQFTCRTCQYTEEAQSTCVFRHVLNNAAGETAGVTQDVGSDPTVGNPSVAHAPAEGAGRAAICPVLWSAGPVQHLPRRAAQGDPAEFACKIDVGAAWSDAATSSADMAMSMDFDFSDLSDEYEFESGTEYGNGDDSAAMELAVF